VGDPTDPNPVQSAALAARGVHPVVAGAGHFLLGGMANGKMAGADELYKKLGRGDEFAFKLYGLTGYLGTTTGRGAMYPSDAESFLPPMTSGRGVIAIAGTWNAMPRTPKSINVADGNFNAPVRDALIEKGLHAPTINLTQVLKIDLENDGPEEYLITAWSPNRGLDGKAASEVRADDYSVVLLRKMVGGRWITYALAFDCYPKAVPGATPTVYRVATVADVDGDGAQEVIVEPQGAGEVAAFRVRNGQLEKVMGGAFAEVGAF
jgi:hypothetical protein